VNDVIELRWATLVDGRKIAYCSHTSFMVQVGRGKGGYATKYTIQGDLEQALFYYDGINIGNGYKKRLLMPSSKNNPVLFTAKS
jgi:hypothetical protein